MELQAVKLNRQCPPQNAYVDNASADLDQFELRVGKRPTSPGLGQLNLAEEGGQAVGILLLVAGARYLDPVKRDITLNYEISCFRSASERA